MTSASKWVKWILLAETSWPVFSGKYEGFFLLIRSQIRVAQNWRTIPKSGGPSIEKKKNVKRGRDCKGSLRCKRNREIVKEVGIVKEKEKRRRNHLTSFQWIYQQSCFGNSKPEGFEFQRLNPIFLFVRFAHLQHNTTNLKKFAAGKSLESNKEVPASVNGYLKYQNLT